MLGANNLGVGNEEKGANVGENVASITQASSNDKDDTITIAVDATLTRGGGMLILHKHKKVYFYSCDWSHLITFPDSSRIHLFNAAVALELFEEYLELYPRVSSSSSSSSAEEEKEADFEEKLIFRTKLLLNNHGVEETSSASSVLNKQFEEYFAGLEKKLESRPFQGTWKFENGDDGAGKEIKDGDAMEICKRLCEKNYTLHKSLPSLKNSGAASSAFSGYYIENVSDSVSAAIAMVSALLQFPLYTMNVCRLRKTHT